MKNPLKSWTFWASIGVIAYGVYSDDKEIIGIGVLNLGLRLKTREAIGW